MGLIIIIIVIFIIARIAGEDMKGFRENAKLNNTNNTLGESYGARSLSLIIPFLSADDVLFSLSTCILCTLWDIPKICL